jgi:hypothetical protein
MYMSSNTPLLTLSQVREWELRKAEIQASIAAQTEEMATLSRKIDAARALMEALSVGEGWSDLPPTLGDGPSQEEAEPQAAPDESISNIVLTAVGAVKAPAKAPAVKNWIVAHHPAVGAKLEANPAYLYTTLTRHVRAGRLTKRGKGYRVVQSSPKGETGGVAPPVPLTD